MRCLTSNVCEHEQYDESQQHDELDKDVWPRELIGLIREALTWSSRRDWHRVAPNRTNETETKFSFNLSGKEDLPAYFTAPLVQHVSGTSPIAP